MNILINPPKKNWSELVKRPVSDTTRLMPVVKKIFTSVEKKGDKAMRMLTKRFDKTDLLNIKVSGAEIINAEKKLSPELKKAIDIAANNIRRFHSFQAEKSEVIETSKGVYCWRESRPIERVGIYIPGGSAPLFSTVLMLVIPARLAGCKEIIICTPPGKDGTIHPAILYAASLTGATTVFKVGGIQAIAALTIGTKTIPAVDKIFGPGNQYVTAAKQYAQLRGTAIDIPAGPSEVLIIADKTADPSFVAADLLSQAEHGTDSQVLVLCTNKKMLNDIKLELNKQLAVLPRKIIAEKCLQNSSAILFNNVRTCVEFSNVYAPEHLILAVKNAEQLVSGITNAGSVFLGNYSCESAGDYASGTNHTLPTNGNARASSGVSLDTFLKKITFQQITPKGIKNLGPVIEEMAQAEELFAHKNAVTIRLNKIKK